MAKSKQPEMSKQPSTAHRSKKKPATLPDHLELLVADASGLPRGKVIKGAAFDEDHLPHLPAAIFFQTLTGTYAEVMHNYDPKDEDLLLQPDWTTYTDMPWKSGSHGQVICQSIDKTGAAVAFDPRNALARVLARYESLGLTPVVAPEAEFYLLKPSTDANAPFAPASGIDGRADCGNEAFSIDALAKYQPLLDLLYDRCDQAGLALSATVHEMGPAQIELNVEHGDALSRADQLFLLKRLVKGCALEQGATASFMAKPIEGAPGSGLHVHCSLYDDDNRNLFTLNKGQAPEKLLNFIAGLQHYLPPSFALITPSPNSYKRFVPDLSAPINLEWGYDNRTTGLRVPYSPDQDGRIESRVAGADANPYLFIAATLACGLLGIEKGLRPTPPTEEDAYEQPANFPQGLAHSLDALANNEEMIDLIGKPCIDAYIGVKRSELEHHNNEINPWERRYLGTEV